MIYNNNDSVFLKNTLAVLKDNTFNDFLIYYYDKDNNNDITLGLEIKSDLTEGVSIIWESDNYFNITTYGYIFSDKITLVNNNLIKLLSEQTI